MIRAAQPNSLAGDIAGVAASDGDRGGMSGVPPGSRQRRRSRRAQPDRVDDNLLVPLLYGERDQHLDRIERQLGVSLVPRGNRLAIAGPGLGHPKSPGSLCRGSMTG